jgi:thiamine-monophosphate kinase
VSIVADFTERELIARISGRLPPAPRWMPIGIGDDAAVVEPERNRLEVLSVDALVEGVHFDRAFTPPRAIGHRALGVNLSDLAAMGATPRLCLLSLALPPALAIDDFDGLIEGIAALARQHRVHVAGGNLTRSPGPMMIDITVIGTVKRRQVLTRSGARPGDELYVTGTVGAAAAGLGMLNEHPDAAGDTSNSCVMRYLYPQPRIRMGLLVGRNRGATASVDLSDGLADAVSQIAHGSGVGAVIDAEAVPVEPGAREWFSRRGEDALRAAITGGDDYELLLAVRPRMARRLTAARRHGDVPLTRIGICTENRAMLLNCGNGSSSVSLPAGFHHFR